MNNILVIEDEQNIRNSLFNIFSSKGISTKTASDGAKGLHLALHKKFDAIILDYMLPKTNGLEICTKLRKKGIYTPVLILSAEKSLEYKIKFFHSGADDYLTKPFLAHEIYARLQSIMRRPSTYHQSLLQEKDITLNSVTHRVYKDTTSLQLTKKEYAILEYLLRFKGIIISRADLFEHVWDKHTDIFSNTLEAHIVTLRRKLGYSRNNFIKCISGRGYMLEASK